MKNYLLLVFLSVIAFSCNSDDNSNTQNTVVNFIEIVEGSLSGTGNEEISQSNVTISNTSDWQSLIEKMGFSTGFAEIDIDFDNYTVFAVFLDVKPSGWKIEIIAVNEGPNIISVTTNEMIFGTANITQPFTIIKIPKTDKEIVVL